MTQPQQNKAGQGYSSKALSAHKSRVSQFEADLEVNSRAIAKQKNADDVQKEHVDAAASSLAPGSVKDGLRWLFDLGLLLAGFSLGFLGNLILADNKFTIGNVLLVVVPFAIGAVLYAFALGRR